MSGNRAGGERVGVNGNGESVVVVVVVVGDEVEVEVKPPMPVLRRFKQDDLNTCHFGPNSTKRQSHVISKRRCVRRSLF